MGANLVLPTEGLYAARRAPSAAAGASRSPSAFAMPWPGGASIEENDVLLHASKPWPWLGVARRLPLCTRCDRPRPGTSAASQQQSSAAASGAIDYCACPRPKHDEAAAVGQWRAYTELDDVEMECFLQSIQESGGEPPRVVSGAIDFVLSQLAGGQQQCSSSSSAAAEEASAPAVCWQPSAGPMQMCDGGERAIGERLRGQMFDHGFSVVHRSQAEAAKARLGIVKGTEHRLDAFVLPTCEYVLAGLRDVDAMRPIELLDDAYCVSESGWLGQATGQRCTLHCALADRPHCALALATGELGESWQRAFFEDASPTYGRPVGVSGELPCAGAALKRFDVFSLFAGQSVLMPAKYLGRTNLVRWRASSNPCDCAGALCSAERVAAAFRLPAGGEAASASSSSAKSAGGRKCSRRKSALGNLSDYKEILERQHTAAAAADSSHEEEGTAAGGGDEEPCGQYALDVSELRSMHIALYDQRGVLMHTAIGGGAVPHVNECYVRVTVDKLEVTELDVDWLCCVAEHDGAAPSTEKLPRTLDKQQIATLKRMQAATPEQVAMSGLRYEYTLTGGEAAFERDQWRRHVLTESCAPGESSYRLDAAAVPQLRAGSTLVLYVIRDTPTLEILWEDNVWQSAVRWDELRCAPLTSSHAHAADTAEHGVQQMSLHNGVRDYYPGMWVCSAHEQHQPAAAAGTRSQSEEAGDSGDCVQSAENGCAADGKGDSGGGEPKRVGLVVSSNFADRVCVVRWHELRPPHYTSASAAEQEHTAAYDIRPYKPFNYMVGCLVRRTVFDDGGPKPRYNVGHVRKKQSDGRVLARFFDPVGGGTGADTLHWPWHLAKCKTHWRYECYEEGDTESEQGHACDAHGGSECCSRSHCDWHSDDEEEDELNMDVHIEFSDDEQMADGDESPSGVGLRESVERQSAAMAKGKGKAALPPQPSSDAHARHQADFYKELRLDGVAKHVLLELVAWNVEQLLGALALCALVIHVHLPRADRSLLMGAYELLLRPLELHMEYMRRHPVGAKYAPAAGGSDSERLGDADDEAGLLDNVMRALKEASSAFMGAGGQAASSSSSSPQRNYLLESSQMELDAALREYVSCRSAANHEFRHWSRQYDKRGKAGGAGPSGSGGDSSNSANAAAGDPGTGSVLHWLRSLHSAVGTGVDVLAQLVAALCRRAGDGEGAANGDYSRSVIVDLMVETNVNLQSCAAAAIDGDALPPHAALLDAFASERGAFRGDPVLSASRRMFVDLERRKDFLPYWDQTYYAKKGDPYARFAAPYKVFNWHEGGQPFRPAGGRQPQPAALHERIASHIDTVRRLAVDFHDRRDSEARRDADSLQVLAPGSVHIADALLHAAIAILGNDVALVRQALRTSRAAYCKSAPSGSWHHLTVLLTDCPATPVRRDADVGAKLRTVLDELFDSLDGDDDHIPTGGDSAAAAVEAAAGVGDNPEKPVASTSAPVDEEPDEAGEPMPCALDVDDYGSALSPDAFEICERAPACHLLVGKRFDAAALRPPFHKAVRREHKMLHAALPHGISVKTFADRMDLFSSLLHGPRGTPYECGLFTFDIKLGHDYGASPPLVQYRAMGMRLNPNLYENGTVCLSLIGTWDGEHPVEKWSAQSSLVQVLLSIQGLVLVAEPYFCEPGFEGARGTASGRAAARDYNEMTIVLVLKSLERLLCDPPEPFAAEIRAAFMRHTDRLCQLLDTYCERAHEVPFALAPITEGFRIAVRRHKGRLLKVAEKLQPAATSAAAGDE